MKFSTKGIYGLQAMIDLAVHNEEGHVALKSIAERQGLSENYLEQLFAILKKAGLVKSARGSLGGYELAEGAEKITVGDILRPLEGPLVEHKCAARSGEKCESSYNCFVTKNVWAMIQNGIDKVTDSITLKQLADEFRKGREHSDSNCCL